MTRNTGITIAALLGLALAVPAVAQLGGVLGGGKDREQPQDAPRRTPAPATAEVYFIEPKDGAVVDSPVRVVFGLRGMGVAPAGVQHEGTGHHHLLIDEPEYYLDRPLPKTEQIVHFGNGQTEALVELAPGEHTLQLLLGDHSHIPHDPPVRSKKIRIRVRDPKAGRD